MDADDTLEQIGNHVRFLFKEQGGCLWVSNTIF